MSKLIAFFFVAAREVFVGNKNYELLIEYLQQRGRVLGKVVHTGVSLEVVKSNCDQIEFPRNNNTTMCL